MTEIHGSPAAPGLQMPAVADSGSEPVPYTGPDLQPEPPDYAAAPLEMSPADGYVVHGVTNLGTTQDPSAYSLSAQATSGAAPYYAGAISAINAAGDDDPGGRDTVAGDVAAAVANATGRWQELQTDTYSPGPVVGTATVGQPHPQQGSVIGDLMHFPPSALDPGAGVGNTLPTAAFYDPPRGGAPETYINTGNEPPPGYQGEAI